VTRSAILRTRWGFLLVTLSAVGFAAKGIFAKIAYREGADPSTVLTLRMLCVLPVYLFGIYWFGKKAGTPVPAGAHPTSGQWFSWAFSGSMSRPSSTSKDWPASARAWNG